MTRRPFKRKEEHPDAAKMGLQTHRAISGDVSGCSYATKLNGRGLKRAGPGVGDGDEKAMRF